jgi:hypothetical protein
MIIAEAMRAGMDYKSAAGEPLSLVQDVIASRQIMEDGYRRELTGDDAEADFLRVMSAR